MAWPVFNARAVAVEMYCNSASYDEIKSSTGINDRNVRRILDRCLTIDPSTGSIYGFFACLEGMRLREYTRRAPFTGRAVADAEGNVRIGGASGMMQLTLEAFPGVEKKLKKVALERDPDHLLVNIPIIDLRDDFHDLLKEAFNEAGLDWKLQWPFTQRDEGYESLRRWKKNLLLTHPFEYLEAEYGEKVANKLQAGQNKVSIFENFRPLSVRQLDFHEIDSACILVFKDPNGVEFEQPVERFHLGAIVSEYPLAICGYIFVFAATPSGDDVLDLLQMATFPEKREGSIMSLIPNGAVVLGGIIPELFGSGFSILKMDNATSNIAMNVTSVIMDVLGCMIQLGGPRKWWSRPQVERFFGIFTRKTNQTLPTTYGKSPVDPMRGDPAAAALRLKIRVEDLLETFEMFCEQFNTRDVSFSTYGQTVNSTVWGMLNDPSQGVFPQPLPSIGEPGWTFFAEVHECEVKGDAARGKPCHINLDNRTYTNERLAMRFDLVGKILIVCRHRWNDNLAFAMIKRLKGGFLGLLRPNRLARRHPMHTRLAKEINKFAKAEWFGRRGKTAARRLLERKIEAVRTGSKVKESRAALDILRMIDMLQKTAEVATGAPPESIDATNADSLVTPSAPTTPIRSESRVVVEIDPRNRLRRKAQRR
ncbi:hypothetical protein [Paraburkholderia sp. 32]|uniref:hypothetical protein n=1 Tax=Paraburkholderia sp. 32 TaxID=2991057 RepID=UPI003D1FB75B